jgi:hypothetical protein
MKDAYRKVGALVEHVVKFLLCGCSVSLLTRGTVIALLFEL